MKFPVVISLGLAAFAGSVLAENEGEQYQVIADKFRSEAEKHAARSDALSEQANEFAEKAAMYTSIADTNEEAADAWERYEEHRLALEAHHASKDKVFADFLVPKEEALSAKEHAYNKAQAKLDNRYLYEKKQHLVTKGKLMQAVQDAKDALIAANKALAEEISRFESFEKATHARKVELASAHNVWKENHEIEWNKKTEEWNAEWDKKTEEKQAAHDEHLENFNDERDEADAANDAYECAKRFNDDEAQGKPLFFLKENVSPPGKTSPNDRTIKATGGWNMVHAEFVGRSMEDGEYFELRGNRPQTGVGLCIEECGQRPGIRFNKNCVGFYGDVPGKMHTATGSGANFEVMVKHSSRYSGSAPGFKYNKGNNCVVYKGSSECIPLPEHFKDQTVRAVGQVWNSGTASISV